MILFISISNILIILLCLAFSIRTGSFFQNDFYITYLYLIFLLSFATGIFCVFKYNAFFLPALFNTLFFICALILSAIITEKISKGSFGGNYFILTLIIVGIIAVGVFFTTFLPAVTTHLIRIAVAQKLPWLFSLTVVGLLVTLGLIYTGLAQISGSDSLLGLDKKWFYKEIPFTALNGDIISPVEEGKYFDSANKPYTGVVYSYQPKLRINPLKPKIDGIAYVIDGQMWGNSKSKNNYSVLNNWQTPVKIDNVGGQKLFLHKKYKEVLETALAALGDYYLVEPDNLGDEKTDNQLYAIFMKNGEIHKAVIEFRPNGTVKEITIWKSTTFNEWDEIYEKHSYFDSLGYPCNRYGEQTKFVWNYDDFIFTDTIPNLVETMAIPAPMSFSKPTTPALLYRGNLWEVDNTSNYDNLYIIHGGDKSKQHVKTYIQVNLLIDGYYRWLNCQTTEDAENIANAIDAAKLVTDAFSNPLGNRENETKLRIQVEGGDSYELLLVGDRFFWEQGFYALSLNPKLAENKNEAKKMKQAKETLLKTIDKVINQYKKK